MLSCDEPVQIDVLGLIQLLDHVRSGDQLQRISVLHARALHRQNPAPRHAILVHLEPGAAMQLLYQLAVDGHSALATVAREGKLVNIAAQRHLDRSHPLTHARGADDKPGVGDEQSKNCYGCWSLQA